MEIPLEVGDRVWAFSETFGDYAEAEIVGISSNAGFFRICFVIFGRMVGDEIECRTDALTPVADPCPVDSSIEMGPPELAQRAAEAEGSDVHVSPVRRLLFVKPKWKRREGQQWHLEWVENKPPENRLAVMILELSTPKSWAEAYHFMSAVAAADWAGQMEQSNPNLPYIEVTY